MSLTNTPCVLESPELSNGGSLQGVVGRRDEPIDLYCEHAKEKANLPSNWHIFKWECFPHGGDETIYVAVTGAVCEHFKTVENTQVRDWKRRDKNTERTVNLPCAEHEAWKSQWEVRTNKCSRCTGTGEVLQSWSVRDGAKTRVCPKCNGTKTPKRKVSDECAEIL